MNYSDLVTLYFERSNALQNYWTLYVVIIGGLLAFSSIRKQRDILTTALVTVLFSFFAYKNLDAIRETTLQRYAALELMKQTPQASRDEWRQTLEATLNPPAYPGVRNFHIVSDLLTIAALWSMERRRRTSA